MHKLALLSCTMAVHKVSNATFLVRAFGFPLFFSCANSLNVPCMNDLFD